MKNQWEYIMGNAISPVQLQEMARQYLVQELGENAKDIRPADLMLARHAVLSAAEELYIWSIVNHPNMPMSIVCEKTPAGLFFSLAHE